MRLKIVSDGTLTRVIDPDTGAQVENVTSVTWQHEARELSVAHIRLVDVAVDLTVDEPVIVQEAI